jgi:hypothetical protein
MLNDLETKFHAEKKLMLRSILFSRLLVVRQQTVFSSSKMSNDLEKFYQKIFSLKVYIYIF